MQKECRKCGEMKEASEFNKNRRRKYGLSDWCKPCNKEYTKTWRYENKGYDKKRYEDDRRKQYLKLWWANNKGRYSQYQREWCQTDKGKLLRRMYEQNRRYRKQFNTNPGDMLTTEQIEYLTEIYTHCAYCDIELTSDNTHIENIQPLSKGGAHSIDNVVLACKDCNLSKGAKTLDQWLADTGYTLTLKHNIPST
jgi:5-methylcytosine-specific restriction endonuclease McrA